MPELPEVETVRKILKKELQGAVIVGIKAPYPKIIENDLSFFIEHVNQQRIIDVERYGKYLVFILEKHVFIVHLRMEGKFYIKKQEPFLKHEHIIFMLEDGRTLRYHDTRKFGRMVLKNKETYLNELPLSKLAGEPWQLDSKAFYQKLKQKKVPIKVALLDQTVIAGLGNIYVDETLFLSRIHPTRKACDIQEKEAESLLKNAGLVLKKAIELGGTTIRSYTASLGVTGRFQNELLVHMQKGKPCPIAGVVEKIKVGGRGTYVCNDVQK